MLAAAARVGVAQFGDEAIAANADVPERVDVSGPVMTLQRVLQRGENGLIGHWQTWPP